MDDEPEQEALFQFEGPDEDGCVWACSVEGHDVWCVNLGPAPKVAEVLSQWLASFESTDEEEKRLAKRLRKIARPKDHRDEGGQG